MFVVGLGPDLECEANRFGLSVTQFCIQTDIYSLELSREATAEDRCPVANTLRSPLM